MSSPARPANDDAPRKDGKLPVAAQEDAGLTTAPGTALLPGRKWQLTVGKMPYSTLETHYNRLGRLCRANKKHFWQRVDGKAVFGGLGILLLGGAIGGAVGLLPFLATDPTHREKVEYYVVVGIVVFVAALCACARMTVKGAEVESAESIYVDFGDTLAQYEEDLKKAMAQEQTSVGAS